jgi:hypothetical protein
MRILTFCVDVESVEAILNSMSEDGGLRMYLMPWSRAEVLGITCGRIWLPNVEFKTGSSLGQLGRSRGAVVVKLLRHFKLDWIG